MRPVARPVAAALALVLGGRAPAAAQQVTDPAFDMSVRHPAHAGASKRLAIDAAHANFHTADGRYAPFAALMRNDGLQVSATTVPFTAESLRSIDVLVIANAGPAGNSDAVRGGGPAFTAAECDAVADWVRAGGALLLVADHAPYGISAAPLAERFGVKFGGGWVVDSGRAVSPQRSSVLAFEGDGLGTHPILAGRNATEVVRRVVAFTGQSMSVPAGAVSLLRLSPRAFESRRPPGAGGPPPWSVAGRSQGVALAFGGGRVVLLGEAALLTAQRLFAPGSGTEPQLIGMNRPGSDDKQFALNVVRWLSGALR